VFRVVGRDDQQGPAIASYLAAKREPKLAAVIDDATPTARASERVEKPSSRRSERASARKGHRQTPTGRPRSPKVKDASPDAVSTAAWMQRPGFAQAGRELGIKAVFAFVTALH